MRRPACGVLDITAALVVYGYLGAKPIRLLQGIASGLLGPKAFDGGLATALLGLLCHFFIAFGAATVYSVASRAIRPLIQYAVVSGVLYGVAVYFFMNRIVLPLSCCRQAPFSHEVDDYRRGHTYLLCGTSDIPERAPIFKMMGSPLVGGLFLRIQFPPDQDCLSAAPRGLCYPTPRETSLPD